MDITTQILEILILLLFIATLVGLVTRRLRLPYTVGLVLMGLILSLVNRPETHALPEFIYTLISLVENRVTPSLIVGLMVTPLIFEAAFHLRWDDLLRDVSFILALAVPGVIFTTILVGVIVYFGTRITGPGFPFPIAVLFGAMMAATDPVSVVALFRSIGVPKRLQVLMEGESLFNDGTAVVVYALVLGIALNNPGAEVEFDLLSILTDFVRVVGGGLIVGLILGWMISKVISTIDDHLIETTLTTVLAFGSYLVGEQLEVSGLLAVVAAGLVNGNIGPKGMSPTTHIVVTNFWEYVAFLSNSFVFLLIGLEMRLDQLVMQWQPILLSILAVLFARGVIVYGLSLSRKDIPNRWSHVLLWGGLRGAISLALALSLPLQLDPALANQLRTMAFGVVLFSILVQGITMQSLVFRMNLIERGEELEEYERRHARAVAARSAHEHLKRLYSQGLFSHHTWQIVSPLLERHAIALSSAVKEILVANPRVEMDELDTARREALRAQRSSLIGLLTDGIISEEIYWQLAREIDMAMNENHDSWAGLINPSGLHSIRNLMTAIIQIQDYENAVKSLNDVGLLVTQLASSGGFLGRRNVTLLIGMGEDQEETAVKALSKSCRRRVEYVSTALEGAPFHLPLSTPVTVGGATIFTFKVDRYEEI